MTNYARAAMTIGLSLGLMLSVPITVSNAIDPKSNNDTQNTQHKKPKPKGGEQNTKTKTPATNSGAQNSGECAPRYAKRGVCKGCKIKLPCPIRQADTPRQAQTPRQAETPRQAQTPPSNLPKDWPTPDNCHYAMPSDPNWKAEEAACHQANMPTWNDRPTPEATPKPDDTIGGGIRSLLQPAADALRQKVDDGIDQAHGAQPTCPSNTSLGQDALSGCHE